MSGAGDKDELLSLVGEVEFPSAGLAGDEGPELCDKMGSFASTGVTGPGREGAVSRGATSGETTLAESGI